MDREWLISDFMLDQNQQLHARPAGYGGSGYKHVASVRMWAQQLGAESILDYGCGEGTLRQALIDSQCPCSLFEYDPAIKGKDVVPDVPVDLVVCTDVLEHVEPERLDNVLKHISFLAVKGIFFVIATRLANKELPCGKNTHLIVQQPEWWKARVNQTVGDAFAFAGTVNLREDGAPKEIVMFGSREECRARYH